MGNKTWECKKHKVVIGEDSKCPLCLEDESYPKIGARKPHWKQGESKEEKYRF